MTEDAKLSGGHILIMAVLPTEWPPVTSQILHNLKVEDGNVQLTVTAQGTFRLGVYDRAEAVLAFVESIPISLPGGTGFILQAQWEGSAAYLRYDNTLIADTSPEARLVHPQPKESGPQGGHDFSAENIAAIRSRRNRLIARVPRAGRIAGGTEHLFEGIRRELAQLMDLVDLVQQGRTHHIVGIATRLRMLIATGTPLPALQSGAAAVDIPLPVYTVGSPRHPMPDDLREKTAFSIGRGAFAQPDAISYNPIDLDVWLELNGATVGPKNLTNRMLIKTVGDTFGAHLDHDIPAEIPALSRLSLGIGQVEFSSLDMFLLQTAESSIELSRRVLSAYEETRI